jgi:single-strand selective monofunctional uracil DNA glycosylase
MPRPIAIAEELLAAADDLRQRLRELRFSSPVTHVYCPLDYAWAPHAAYVRRFGNSPKRVLMLGMNPGPFGMAQTGVPFGEIAAVRDWMGICEPVGRPDEENPKRPVEGFSCRRSEVSGKRLWGWAARQFGRPEAFFRDAFVVNYCPLIFLEESGRNRTPDKIPSGEMAPVEEACDAHLRRVIELLDPEWLVGVGGFAEARLRGVSGPDARRKVARIPHPSPANPAANKDWEGAVRRQVESEGIWKL